MGTSKEKKADSPRRGGGRLVVMAKAPRPGMVKTRLAQSLPVEAVTELYRCFLDDTMELSRSLRSAEVAIMCPGPDVDELKLLAQNQHAVRVVAQQGKGLAA